MFDRNWIAALGLGITLWTAAQAARAEGVSFRRDIAPLLVARCLGCHTEEDRQGGLSLETFARLKQGGAIEGEAILEPGEPGASHLVSVLKPEAMPRMPLKQTPLTDEEIGLVERWVAEGARFDGPSEETRLAVLVDPLAAIRPVEVKSPAADPVTALAFSAGGVLAVGRGDTVQVFESGLKQPAFTLEGHPGAVNFVRFSADGKTLWAAGGKPGLFGFIACWNLDDRTRQVEIRCHDDAVLAAAISPDGRTLATASYDRMVKLWDLPSVSERAHLKEHTDAVFAVAFAPDGKTLATAAGDRTVKTWDVATGKRLVSLSDATAELYCVSFRPDGKGLLAAGADKRIWSWRLEAGGGRLEASPVIHDGPVLRLLVDPSGKSVFSAGEDRAVKQWELPGLRLLGALPVQSDWPMALDLSPGNETLAVGRYDGSVVALPIPGSTAEPRTLLEAPRAAAERTASEVPRRTELRRDASLGPPSPRLGHPGQKLVLNLSGNGVGQAFEVVFDDPSIGASIVREGKSEPNGLKVELTIAEDARPGPRRLWVVTPTGVPAAQVFWISPFEESAEAEPNDRPDQAKAAKIGSLLSGTLGHPGDADHWKVAVGPGQVLVARDRGKELGSSLDPELELRDGTGSVVARGSDRLVYQAGEPVELTLRIGDKQYGGSGNHFYRIEFSESAYVRGAFPRGVEIGKATSIGLEGLNLREATLRVEPDRSTTPGTVLSVAVPATEADRQGEAVKVVAAQGSQSIEEEPNDSIEASNRLAMPGGASGKIDRPGDADLFKFEGRRGRPVVVEVFGQRIGGAVDTLIEILDAQGHAVPRALLRPVAETHIAFRDHNARQSGIRLTKWDELAINDYLLVGRELMRVFALPRNPDDDAQFWSAGGRRLGYLGTTPEQHPMGQPMQKVEIYPAGTTFPPGVAAITVPYVNDDGGPGMGSDSYLLFDPPSDGDYVVRVADARGLSGPDHVFHVLVREPRPDFELSLSNENINIHRGGTAVVTASVRRIDGFDGPIDVSVEALPMGISAVPARIESGHFTAEIGLRADAPAPAFSAPSWRVVAEARPEGSSSSETLLRHELDPGGRNAGWITVTPDPDLRIDSDRDHVRIRPGEEVGLVLRVVRSEAFRGRVPIDVRNLPHGVRVLDIGLNGVLITEKEDRRVIRLYAEPWVKPMERPFYAVGRVEAAGTSSSSSPIWLEVEPLEPPAVRGD